MGGGASKGAEAVRDVGGLKLYARAISGVDDQGSEVDGRRGQAIARLRRRGDRRASPRTARRASSSRVTDDLTGRLSAVDLVRVASAALGGKGGGGRPDMAQAGGPDGAKAEAALAAIEEALKAKAA